MLNLPITLLAIDCVSPERTLRAIKFSCFHVRFSRIVLLTNTKRFRISAQFNGTPVELAHTEQSDRKLSPYPGHPPIAIDYDRDVLVRSKEFCDTSHLLQLEWDSAILNPAAWDWKWLDYDFIGAPWPNHKEPGWPECNEGNNVGNFGFSLKSKYFCEMCATAYTEAQNNPEWKNAAYSSDRFICRTARHTLETDNGVKFASAEQAMRFSCENQIYSGQFGYHGKNTAKINGWNII